MDRNEIYTGKARLVNRGNGIVLRCATKGELAELLADDVSPDPVDTVSENETVQEVRLLLSQLPERESTVLRLRYGIPGDRCRTLDEIGAQLGVTRERIRQIQVRAERHLREMLKRRSSSTLFAA